MSELQFKYTQTPPKKHLYSGAHPTLPSFLFQPWNNTYMEILNKSKDGLTKDLKTTGPNKKETTCPVPRTECTHSCRSIN